VYNTRAAQALWVRRLLTPWQLQLLPRLVTDHSYSGQEHHLTPLQYTPEVLSGTGAADAQHLAMVGSWQHQLLHHRQLGHW